MAQRTAPSGPRAATRRRHRIVAALVLCSAGPVAAAQLAFESSSRGSSLAFTYTFEVPEGPPRSLHFELRRAAVAGAVNAFEQLNIGELRQTVTAQHAATLRRLARGLRARFPDVEIIVDDRGTLSYRTRTEALARSGSSQQDAIDAFNAEVARYNAWTAEEPPRLLRAYADELNVRFPQARFSVGEDGSLSVTSPGDREEARRIETAMRDAMARFERELERRISEHRALLDAQQRAIEADQTRLDASILELRRQFESSRAEIEAAIADAREEALAAQASYLRERAYTTLDARSLVPDYRTIAREATRTLQPVADAFLDSIDSQALRIDALMGFMQSIPYDTLESRLTSNGAGFALPLALIGRNRGDCDTKAVAFAAVLQGMAPEIPVIMLLLEDHALLGLGLDAGPGDRTFDHDGRSWVLAEPVGPALLPVGRVGPDTAAALGGVQAVVPLF